MPKVKISEYSSTANSNTDVASINIDEGCAPSGINNAIRAVMGHLKDFQTGAVSDPLTVGGAFTTSSTVTHNGGTANGVAYLNGSKVLTTGSALVFDGTNLGVGVTPSAWNSDYRALDVSNYGNLYGRISTPNTGLTLNCYRNSGGSWIYKNTSQAARYDQDSGFHIWYNAASGTAGNAITFTQAMTLDASGNLGVGVTTIGQKLEIGSSGTVYAKISSSTNSSFRGVQFGINGESNTYGSVAMEVNGGELRTSAGFGGWGGYQTFYTNGSERARIDSSGNLLVGTTSSVIWNTTTTGVAIGSSAIQGSRSGDAALLLNRTSSDGNIAIFARQGSAVGNISVTASATAYNTSSDYRLKNTIAPMTGALAKVALLKPCTYKWNIDGSNGQGFIAHELQEVIDGCVTGEKDAVDSNGNPQYQGIDTSFLVATLTAAIQELNAKFEAYKATHP